MGGGSEDKEGDREGNAWCKWEGYERGFRRRGKWLIVLKSTNNLGMPALKRSQKLDYKRAGDLENCSLSG